LLAQDVAEADAETAVAFADRVELLFAANGRLGIAFVLALIGLWLLLPTGRADWRRTGMLICVVAGCFFASLFKPLGDLLTTCTFSLLASITAVSAVATIASRNPVYSAIWFALTLLGTGGLFLLNGAHFLGVATVAVYAGAIVVTFLFVLMLAQPEGHAFYDRISWGGTPTALAAAAGLLIVAVTVWNVNALGESLSEPTTVKVLNPHHVASLGGNLFTKHIIAIQAAGALLFAALVGAVAIAGRDQLIGRQVGSAVDRVLRTRLGTNPGGRTDV
jgi:NADH-quinone oxidoreductase subunit J